MIKQLQIAAKQAAGSFKASGRAPCRSSVRLLRSLAVVATALLLAGPLMDQPVSAQTTAPAQNDGLSADGAKTVATHADWTVRCGPNPQTQTEVCYMVQGITSKETGRGVMQLAIGKFGPEKRDLALITLPLGVRLPPGIAIEVTGKERRKLPFERCLRSGCQAQLLIDQAVLSEFKAGVDGRILFYDLNGKPGALPFSLQGFTAAFAGIK